MIVKGLSIYQRKSDGRWIGSIELESTNGKRNRKNVSAKTEKEVKRKANKLVYEIENGDYSEPSKDTLIGFFKEYHKVRAGCNMWEDDYIYPEKAKWAVTTAELYKMYIDVHFEPYFGNIKMESVGTIELDRFCNYKLNTPREYKVKTKKGYVTQTRAPSSNNTVIKYRAFMKAAFNYAKINKRTKDNPADFVVLEEMEEYEPNIYNERQFLKLLNYIENTDDEIYVLIAAGCGLRRGEICGLEWKDIDFKEKTLTVKKARVRMKKNHEKIPKTRKSTRTIIAPDYVTDVLKKYKSKLREEPTGNDKIITRWKPQSLSERFKKLLDMFGLPRTRLHDLRHYNAVIMMKHGVPDKVASERLGHSNVQVLHKIYQHVQKDTDKAAADNINKMFDKEK